MLACDAGLAFRTRLGTSAAAGLRGWVHLAEPMWKPQTAAQVPTASAKRVHVAVAL